MEYQYLFHDRTQKYMPEIDALVTTEQIKAHSDKLSMGSAVARAMVMHKVKAVQEGRHEQVLNLFDSIRHYLFITQQRVYLYRTKGGERLNLYTKEYADCIVAAYNALIALGEDAEKASCSQKCRDYLEKGRAYRAAQAPKLWKLILWPMLFVAFWALICHWITGPSSADFLASTIIEDTAMAVIVIAYLIAAIILWMKSGNVWVAGLVPLIGIPVIFVLAGKAAQWVMTRSPAMAEALKDTSDYFFPLVLLVFLITLAIALIGIVGNAPALGKEKRLRKIREELTVLRSDEELRDEVFFFGLMVDVTDDCEIYASERKEGYESLFWRYKEMTDEKGREIVELVRKHFKPLLEEFNKIAETI